MYKERIRRWGIEKNIKPKEMKAIIHKQAERLRTGKKSVFYLRNNQVPEHKIERYQRCMTMGPWQQASSSRPKTPPELACYTPLATPLSTPQALELPERIAKVVQNYVYGSFEKKIWMATENQACVSTWDSVDYTVPFEDKCVYAALLFKLRRRENAWQVLDMAVALVEQIVFAESPYTLKSVAAAILSGFLPNSQTDITGTVLKQLSAMSATKKCKEHPFNHIFPRLVDLEASCLQYALGVAQQSQLDCFVQKLGPFNSLTLSLELSIMSMEINSERLVERCWRLLELYEIKLGAFDPRYIIVQCFGRKSYYEQCDFKAAAAIAQFIVNLAEKHPKDLLIVSEALHTLSIAQCKLNEIEKAESNIREAILRRVNASHGYDDRALHFMSVLVQWLTDLDKLDDAREWHTATEKTLNSRYQKFKDSENERWARYNPSIDSFEDAACLRSVNHCISWENITRSSDASTLRSIPGTSLRASYTERALVPRQRQLSSLQTNLTVGDPKWFSSIT